jgi:hypothetical protein
MLAMQELFVCEGLDDVTSSNRPKMPMSGVWRNGHVRILPDSFFRAEMQGKAWRDCYQGVT